MRQPQYQPWLRCCAAESVSPATGHPSADRTLAVLHTYVEICRCDVPLYDRIKLAPDDQTGLDCWSDRLQGTARSKHISRYATPASSSFAPCIQRQPRLTSGTVYSRSSASASAKLLPVGGLRRGISAIREYVCVNHRADRLLCAYVGRAQSAHAGWAPRSNSAIRSDRMKSCRPQA